MKRRAATYLIALVLLSACNPKEALPLSRIEMDLGTQTETKAHFEDIDGSASFVWDVGSSMIAVVGHGAAPVQWTGGRYWSPMHISLIDP